MRCRALTVVALALAGCIAGCGSAPQGESLTISFQAPKSGPLAERAADMRRAAELFVDGPGKNVAGKRLVLASGPAQDSIASIDALAPRLISAPDELTITLFAPPRRVINAPRKQPINASQIQLVPPMSLARSAAQQYAASGVAGSEHATVDSPSLAGTPRGRYVTAALARPGYPPAGGAFFQKFEDKYGRAPDRWAIYAYEAVGLIADAIRRLEQVGVPASPRTVAAQALKIRNRYGAIGHYDVLPSGQTTDYIFQARGPGTDPEDPATLIEALR